MQPQNESYNHRLISYSWPALQKAAPKNMYYNSLMYCMFLRVYAEARGVSVNLVKLSV